MNRILFALALAVTILCTIYSFASAKSIDIRPETPSAAATTTDSDLERSIEIKRLCVAWYTAQAAEARYQAFQSMLQVALILERQTEPARAALYDPFKTEVGGMISEIPEDILGFAGLREQFGRQYDQVDFREITLQLRVAVVELNLRSIARIAELRTTAVEVAGEYPDIGRQTYEDVCMPPREAN